MNIQIVDTESAYRRLLAESDAAAREAIYCETLIAPFAGLVNFFGGGDALAQFGQWGMPLDLFGGERREATRALI